MRSGFNQIVKRIVHQVLAALDTPIVSTGAITAPNVTDTALTSGRVTMASTGGLLADDADLTFSGATLTATNIVVGTGLTNTALTAGRVVLAGTAGILTSDSDLTFSGATTTATNLVVGTALTNTALTSGRVVVASTAGLLADDSDLTFSGSTLTATNIVAGTGLTNTALTSGRVVIASTAGLLADDSDLTFSAATLTATGLAVGSTGATVTGTLTPTGGIVASTLGRVPNIDVGSVAYASLGTNTTPVAGTIYVSEIWLPANKTITGIGFLNGGTVGTDSAIVGLYDASNGVLLRSSALAGAVTSGANAFQEFALTSTYAAVGPAKYLVAVQVDGTTTRIRTIAASTYLRFTISQAGVFGTMATLAPLPTATVADVGPVAYAY